MPHVDRSAALLAATYDFGETAFTFESNDEEWLGWLERRYLAFRTLPRGSGFTVRFEPTNEPAPADLVTPLAVHLEAIRIDRTPVGFRAWSETTSCDVDLRSRTAVLRGPSAMYPVDNLLRYLLPVLWNEGVVVHAAFLLLRSGRGLVAGGPSGAGKSTLARLASSQAFCDELTAVRVDGVAGSHVVSLPFWESRPGRAPLEALLFLAHGQPHRLSLLRREEAFRRLVPLILWPVWDESAMASTFTHLARLVESTPAFELAFAPSPDAWRFIDKEFS